jgi:phage terminase large subunit-like protein
MTVYHHKNMADLEYQLIAFPNALNDDILDSLSNCFKMLSPHTKGEGQSYAYQHQTNKSDLDELFNPAQNSSPLSPKYHL